MYSPYYPSPHICSSLYCLLLPFLSKFLLSLYIDYPKYVSYATVLSTLHGRSFENLCIGQLEKKALALGPIPMQLVEVNR